MTSGHQFANYWVNGNIVWAGGEVYSYVGSGCLLAPLILWCDAVEIGLQ